MNYLSERDVLNIKMGRVLTDEEIVALTPKRYRVGRLEKLNASDLKYVICDICHQPFTVNTQFTDRKPRTPRYKDFIVCMLCDPRHADDRYMKEGYRVIHPGRLRVIQMAQIVRQVTKWECRNPAKIKCNCASCVSKKLFPPF